VTQTANQQPNRQSAGRPSQSSGPLKLKTYRAWTMSEALASVKQDLGHDAVILHTRTFERGGIFGFGRKTVVELTAARASDMPSEPAVSERTPAAAQRAPSAAAQRAPSAAAQRAPVLEPRESLRLSAAARAYGSAATPSAQVSAADASRDLDPPMNLEAEREKTRRLAQAMAIQLEKQASAREAATQNERATAQSSARETRAATSAPTPAATNAATPLAPASAPASPAARVPTHPLPQAEPVAQRFVLVAQPASTGGKPSAPVQNAVVQLVSGTPKPTPAASTAPAPQAAARPAPAAQPRAEAVAGFAPIEFMPTQPDSAAPAISIAAPLSTADRSQPQVRPETRPSAQPDNELNAISDFVGRVLEGRAATPAIVEPKPVAAPSRTPASAPIPAAAPRQAVGLHAPAERAEALSRPEVLERAYARLIEQEVAAELAEQIVASVERELQAAIDAGAMPSEAVVRDAFERRIASLLPADAEDGLGGASGRVLPGKSGARRIAFVGPTGVGKTTTLAKIAAQLKLKRGLSVGIVAADTYRIAAVDQLRTYAEILEVPVEVASSPADAERACQRLDAEHGVDVILLDTAGRSQNDRMKLSELRAFLVAARPDETHLVLSATAGARTLEREAAAFGAVGIDRIVLTKLDEAATFGTLISLVERLGKRVSFLTHGQEVPDHIEPGRGRRLAELVMGSEVR